MKAEPIRVGDLLDDGKTEWTVIRCLPGGRLELFDKKRTRFTNRYHREIKLWSHGQAEGGRKPEWSATDTEFNRKLMRNKLEQRIKELEQAEGGR